MSLEEEFVLSEQNWFKPMAEVLQIWIENAFVSRFSRRKRLCRMLPNI